MTRASAVPFLVVTAAVMEHMAFEYGFLDELLGAYARLKAVGISVELSVSNYGDTWTSIEHVEMSPDFARGLLGVDINPDKMIAAEGLS